MFIQQHIVAANALLDKVDKIKDQMDRGELDGKSNLGSMLNSVADDGLGSSGHENSSTGPKIRPKSPKSRGKHTVKKETARNTAN
jgi:hypothetical protein